MIEFVAHLHPLLVHLPIGILLLAALFALMGRQDHHASLLESLPMLLRIGAVAAVLSCCSGWLLGEHGDYNAATLQLHRWLGISTTAVAILACFTPKRLAFITLAAILLVATGHFGGTLTHGEGYLTQSFPGDAHKKPRPADIQEATVYTDIIDPIFQEKCITCHGNAKQKGGLRLDKPELIQKGGKDGQVLKPADPGNCELLRRCLLPLSHEDHMPPKEKPQLSIAELEILRWWLSQGGDFQKKTKELPQTELVRNALVGWQSGAVADIPSIPDVPAADVSAAPTRMVEKLRQASLLVMPVSRGKNWLSVNFVNLPNPPDSVFVWLEKIAPQVVWLNMSNCNAPETAWNSIGKLNKLTRLSLDHSSVSDSSFLFLKNLYALQYLNLAETRVTGKGLFELREIKGLQRIFLYHTGVATAERATLQIALPQLKIDTGTYVLPFLETDTARLKTDKPYK